MFDEIRKMISDDAIEKAFIVFQKDILNIKEKFLFIEKVDDFEKEIISMQGRLSTAHKEYIQGTITRDVYSVERVKITKSLLITLNDYENYKLVNFADDTVNTPERESFAFLLRDIRLMRDVKILGSYRKLLYQNLSNFLAEKVYRESLMNALHEWKSHDFYEDETSLERLINSKLDNKLKNEETQKSTQAIIENWHIASIKDIVSKINELYTKYGLNFYEYSSQINKDFFQYDNKLSNPNLKLLNSINLNIDGDLYKSLGGIALGAFILSTISFPLGILTLIVGKIFGILSLPDIIVKKKKKVAFEKLSSEFNDTSKIKNNILGELEKNNEFNSFVDKLLCDWYIAFIDEQIVRIERKKA